MIRQPVASSDLRAGGGIYQYFGVPGSTYSGLMQAGSKGRYFRAFIKGRYAYQKVG